MPDDANHADRVRFLTVAILFQGSLLLFALLAGWLLGQPIWNKLAVSTESIGLGVIATLPMFLFLVLVYQSSAPQLVQIRQLLREILGRPLAVCHWPDLCGLALLAGVSEEFLFRGMLEPWLSGFSPLIGLIVSNLLFGFCHAVTPTYAVLASLMGLYLSSTLWWTTEPNLLIPIICHALYDLVAFAVVRRSYSPDDPAFRRNEPETPSAEHTPSQPIPPANQ